ncbi:MAG: EamA family transporter [Moorellales bacterium]
MGQVANVAPVVAAYPLVAMSLAVLLLGEKITLGRGLGAALIVLGIWLIRRG